MPDSAEVTEPRWGMWHVTEMTNRQLYDAIDECEHITRQHLNHGGTAKQRERRRWQCIRAESWLVILRGEQVRRKLVPPLPNHYSENWRSVLLAEERRRAKVGK